MARLVWLASLTALAGALTLAQLSAPEAGDPCVRKDFKTELVKQACEKGGQAAAKDAMKAFVKETKAGTCTRCHATQSPDYDLKPEGLEQFLKLGGK
jgi:hypothetical protein